VINPQWSWLAYHYEQYSYENADVAYFPSYFLKSKLESYGWVKQGNHLPYFVPIVELQGDETTNLTPPTPLPYEGREEEFNSPPRFGEGLGERFPIVFFGRLEERKGFCTFVEAIKLLNRDVIDKIQIIFIGKIIPLQSSQYQHLDSQQYIEEQLDGYVAYKVLPNLSSQEAIKFVRELNHPIVCLTSLQENFPNTGLEMGQLPVSLVVSDTGGFNSQTNLIAS
ncbi:MAG: glycosyltransferase, partial [Cyanobacteria bacterium J06629_18]